MDRIHRMPMDPDEHVCYCFHVPLRKIEKFCRNQKPVHASQISECLSAGTGCGWCRPLLRKIHRRMCGNTQPWWREEGADMPDGTSAADYDTPEAYAAARQAYIQRKKQDQVAK